MRLPLFEHLGVFSKLFVRISGLVSGAPPPDILPMLLYKRKLFGDHIAHAADTLLRGPSEWTVAERELMAAFVSRTNECGFCVNSHTGVARAAGDPAVIDAALADLENAPVAAKLRFVLRLLEQLSLKPEAVTQSDVEELRNAGLSDEAIVDAVYIASLFCVVNRVANALDFAPGPSDPHFLAYRMLLKRGYRFPGSSYPSAIVKS